MRSHHETGKRIRAASILPRADELLAEAEKLRHQARVMISRADEIERLATGAHPDQPHVDGSTLLLEGRSIALTPMTADLLDVLLRHAGTPVSDNALRREVWGDSTGVSNHAIRQRVFTLRTLLREGGEPAAADALQRTRSGWRLDPWWGGVTEK
ncbi:MAG: transcriptional regulator [Phycisphaerales bacterium]